MFKRKSQIKKQDLLNIINDPSAIIEKHPEISGLKVISGKNFFPISWIQKLNYCEYQLYLEHFKKFRVKPTLAMITGSKEHHRLEAEFKEDAEPATFEQMLELSLKTTIYSREFPVMSIDYGIHGVIDEIQMGPDGYYIIDDKPGTTVYASNAYQVLAYCLAFKYMVNDNKPLFAGLRERGTDNIYWKVPFDNEAESKIISVVNRVHNLLNKEVEFESTDNPNKCLKCRFFKLCDKRK